MTDITTTLHDALRVANSIRDAVGGTAPTDLAADVTLMGIPQFTPAEPLTSHLTALGLVHKTAEQLSRIYLNKAEQLRISSEASVRNACARLVCLPQGGMDKESLQQRLFESYHHIYNSTLSQWAEETTSLVRSRLASAADMPALAPSPSSKLPIKKHKRQFKSEYLPLFEFAFEKDRFPSREDKKHLAKISSMSYRQVCVWFQNRRCRHASRVKSQHITPPPQTFEEMKQRLGASAREALSKPNLNKGAPSRSSSCTSLVESFAIKRESPAVQERPVRGRSEEIMSPASSGRETSLEVSEDGEERDELDGDDDMVAPAQLTTLLSTPSLSPSPPLISTPTLSENPLLNPLKTPTASVFPAPYKPSELTFDPFVVAHQPWVRHPVDINIGLGTRAIVELDDVMGGFESMDVGDIEMPDDEEEEPARMMKPLPRRAPSTPPHIPISVQRTFSSSSSGSSGSWSDASRALSYSTAPSSVVSSPHLSEVSLPAEEIRTAGPSDFSCAGKRVSAWVTDVGEEKEGEDRWEQLLAAASVATSA